MNVKHSSSLAAKSFFPLHFACCHLLLCHRPLVGPMEARVKNYALQRVARRIYANFHVASSLGTGNYLSPG